MPKDTKSLGNNKAPACESRGFVRHILGILVHSTEAHTHWWETTIVEEVLHGYLAGEVREQEQLRMKADYNCEYDVSNSDVENMQQPAHDFLNSIIKLIKEKQ